MNTIELTDAELQEVIECLGQMTRESQTPNGQQRLFIRSIINKLKA